MKITDQVADLSKRVGALEGAGIEEGQPVARITKAYGTIRVTYKITTKIHTYKRCSTRLVCSESLII